VRAGVRGGCRFGAGPGARSRSRPDRPGLTPRRGNPSGPRPLTAVSRFKPARDEVVVDTDNSAAGPAIRIPDADAGGSSPRPDPQPARSWTAQPGPAAGMTAVDGNRDVARTELERVCARGDMALARDCYAENLADHVGSLQFHGYDGIARSTALCRAVVDDLALEVAPGRRGRQRGQPLDPDRLQPGPPDPATRPHHQPARQRADRRGLDRVRQPRPTARARPASNSAGCPTTATRIAAYAQPSDDGLIGAKSGSVHAMDAAGSSARPCAPQDALVMSALAAAKRRAGWFGLGDGGR
jgi:hypothetical protein